MGKPQRMAIILFFLCIPLISGCRKRTEEDLIRHAVEDALRAAEDKDISSLMKHVSKDCNDGRGNGYDGIRGILFYELVRPGKVRIFVREMSIDVKGGRASVEARVAAVRGKAVEGLSDILPDDANALRFTVIFRKEEGAWKALGADWEPAGLTGLL